MTLSGGFAKGDPVNIVNYPGWDGPGHVMMDAGTYGYLIVGLDRENPNWPIVQVGGFLPEFLEHREVGTSNPEKGVTP